MKNLEEEDPKGKRERGRGYECHSDVGMILFLPNHEDLLQSSFFAGRWTTIRTLRFKSVPDLMWRPPILKPQEHCLDVRSHLVFPMCNLRL